MMRFPGRRILPLFLLLSLSCIVQPLAWAAKIPHFRNPENRRIRVLIADSEGSAMIGGFDLRLRHGQGESEIDSSLTMVRSYDRGTEWEIRCTPDHVALTEKSGKGKMKLTHPVVFDTPAGILRWNDRLLRESVWIYSAGTKCQFVNELGIEKYLDGLVNSEFSPHWSEEAIAAQVVAARTYALHQIRHARIQDKRFDVHGTVKDQVYEGSQQEHHRAARAVERTRGLVLTTGQGAKAQPIKAFYHSTCGGITETPERVWGEKHAAFRRSVRCPYCASSPRYDWSTSLREEEIRSALVRAVGTAVPKGWPKDAATQLAGARLLSITPELSRKPASKNERPRARNVVMNWKLAGGKPLKLTIPANRFREWLGYSRLMSTAFQVRIRNLAGIGQVWDFEGRGNGHGVGMCQWGAKVMGEKGHKMAGILKFYYPDANLAKLW